MNLPYPWIGGKRKIADEVWKRLGKANAYIEPFFGGGAVFFAMPHKPKLTILNDIDGFIPNFLRAVQAAPDQVAHWIDWEITEADLYARHSWLCQHRAGLEQLLADPDYYDAQAAGWWAWGVCIWMGKGWGQDWHHKKRPEIGHNKGVIAIKDKPAYLQALSAKLRGCYTLCGSWERAVTDSLIQRKQPTAIFLDPPYTLEHTKCHPRFYVSYDDVAGEVAKWAIERGDDPSLRVAVCGVEGEHKFPGDWGVLEWSSNGGFGNMFNSAQQRHDERVWFSPGCQQELTLF